MSDILSERSGAIVRVTLNRPAKKNAMTSEMYVALAGVFDNAAKDERVRVVHEEFASRVRSPEAKDALTRFLEKRPRDFTKSKEHATAQ